MLREIKELLKERDSVSLSDLSIRFNVEESPMEKMMEMLIRKGTVEKEEIGCSTDTCGGCGMRNCRPSEAIFYRRIAK